MTGGTTYCVIASYSLANRLSTIKNRAKTLRWLVDRQVVPPIPEPSSPTSSTSDSVPRDGIERNEAEDGDGPIRVAGFQGRIGKATDACYSFWCSASIHVRCILLLCLAVKD